MVYGCYGSSASSSDTRSTLDNTYDYDNPIYTSYNYSDMIGDIVCNNPVYLAGCRTLSPREWWEFWDTHENCHAWVCDGY